MRSGQSTLTWLIVVANIPGVGVTVPARSHSKFVAGTSLFGARSVVRRVRKYAKMINRIVAAKAST